MKFTKRERYLLSKLAEEAAEVAQASIKHMLKGTTKSECRLAAECGDFRAILRECIDAGLIDAGLVSDGLRWRRAREHEKANK